MAILASICSQQTRYQAMPYFLALELELWVLSACKHQCELKIKILRTFFEACDRCEFLSWMHDIWNSDLSDVVDSKQEPSRPAGIISFWVATPQSQLVNIYHFSPRACHGSNNDCALTPPLEKNQTYSPHTMAIFFSQFFFHFYRMHPPCYDLPRHIILVLYNPDPITVRGEKHRESWV